MITTNYVQDAGAVFTWGSGRKGQLGHGRSGVSHANQPELGIHVVVDCFLCLPALYLTVKALKGKVCTKVCAMAHCTAVCTGETFADKTIIQLD